MESTDGNKRLPRDKGEQNADFKPWQNASSRIIRVSRVSGGKDRHSKVWTTKGLRDRRVRLSVSTAIQFYDLQDRLGYDQPSKAVDWLIKAADAAIADLPELDAAFPIPPTMLQISPSKSACSSASETSREKRNGNEQTNLSTFTELLTAGSEYFVGQNGVFAQQARKLPQFVPGYPLHAYNAEQEMQQYSFVQDHVIPVVDHDVNVSISSVFAGFNRGTLQSNSPYHHHVVDGANLPFFFGASIAAAAEGGSSENQCVGGFNGRLQVCCNEARRQAKLKGEGKG